MKIPGHMDCFFRHYFLVAAMDRGWDCGCEQKKPEKSMVEFLSIEWEDNLVVWEYLSGKVLWKDMKAFLRREVTDGFKKWIEFCKKYVDEKNVDDYTTLMSSMGCGSSDNLFAKDIREFEF